MVKLSKRLQAVADFVTAGNRICDVGTDHGYIPIYLLQNERIPSALAMDVNQGPLLRACEHIEQEGLTEYIETRQSNGLQRLQQKETDSVVIAGMGGGLIIRILEEGYNKLEAVKELILQPQSDIEEVRRYLRLHEFLITEEQMVYEDGKYYVILHCIHQKTEAVSDVQQLVYDRYGRYLMEQRHSVLLAYLEKEEQQLNKILDSLGQQSSSEAVVERIAVVRQQLAVLTMAREEMQVG